MVLTFNLQQCQNNLALDPLWVSDWNATCSLVRERWLSHRGGDTHVRRVEFPAGAVTAGRWRRTWPSRVQLLSGLGEGAQAPQSDWTHMRPDVCARALKMQLWFIDSTTWVMRAWLYQTDNNLALMLFCWGCQSRWWIDWNLPQMLRTHGQMAYNLLVEGQSQVHGEHRSDWFMGWGDASVHQQ